jgi:hypothetical protein
MVLSDFSFFSHDFRPGALIVVPTGVASIVVLTATMLTPFSQITLPTF